MYAGLQKASGELVAVMDIDLQDPPELLPQMVKMIEEGEYDSVATRRKDRDGESRVRSFFARQFYKWINKVSSLELVDGARDFRVMTRQWWIACFPCGNGNDSVRDSLTGSALTLTIFLTKTANGPPVKLHGPSGD
mgnify:CR=1 FL=1